MWPNARIYVANSISAGSAGLSGIYTRGKPGNDMIGEAGVKRLTPADLLSAFEQRVTPTTVHTHLT